MLHLPSLPLTLPFVTGEAKPLRQRGGRSEVRSFQWFLYNYYHRNGDKSLFVLQMIPFGHCAFILESLTFLQL